MNFYLRTLEGAPRMGVITIEDFKNKIAYRREYFKQDVENAVYYQLLEILDTEGEGNYTGIKNYIENNYRPGEAARRGLDRVESERAAAAEAAEATRRRQKEARQKQEAAAAEAYRAAMNAKREAEEEAARAALEAQQVEEAEAAAVIIDEAQQVINEGATMEQNEIEITPQVVNVEHEFYIIDEDENTITYQDETGKMYVEQKSGSNIGWIIAAAVGAFLLL